jgi:hypothetical protein
MSWRVCLAAGFAREIGKYPVFSMKPGGYTGCQA